MTRSRIRVSAWLALTAAAAAALVMAATVFTSQPGKTGQPRSPLAWTAPAMPAHGAYFGAWAQPARYRQLGRFAAVDALQHRIGRRLDIVHSYLRWQAPFPTASQRAMMRQGSLLLLSWAGADTRAIAAGAYDTLIRHRARAVRATAKPIFLEWRWEMNRPGLISQIHSPADYIAAWGHIRAIFAQEHVTNAAWVWCPSSMGFGKVRGRYRSAAAFYPGDNEVDWICVDAYPRANGFTSFADIVQPFLAWASHIAKPIIIGEYGVPRSYGQQLRAQWLREAAKVVRANKQIKALVYYDGDPSGRTPELSYGLDSGSAPMRAFGRIAMQPYFNPPRRASSSSQISSLPPLNPPPILELSW